MELPAKVPLLHLPFVPFPGVALELPAAPQTARLWEQTEQGNLVFAVCADSVMAVNEGAKVGGLAELTRKESGAFQLHVVARGKLRAVESLTPVPIVSWEPLPEEEAGDLRFLVGPLLEHAGGLIPAELHAFLRLPNVMPENAINLVALRWPLTRQEHQALLELPSAEARAKQLLQRPAGGPSAIPTPLRLRWSWKLATWKQNEWIYVAVSFALAVAVVTAMVLWL